MLVTMENVPWMLKEVLEGYHDKVCLHEKDPESMNTCNSLVWSELYLMKSTPIDPLYS